MWETPDERRLSAERLAAEIPSPAVLTIATVTARGEPRVSAVDGHFLHSCWHWTTAAESPKARQLLRDHFVETYGGDPEEWGSIAYFRIDADWLVGFAMTDAEMEQIEADKAAREHGRIAGS